MSDATTAYLTAVATVWGGRELSAAELAQRQGCSTAAVERSLGDSRIHLSEAESRDDLTIRVAQRCLARAGREPNELDGMLAVGYPGVPPNRLLLQDRLGARQLDLSGAVDGDCSIVFDALRMARAMVTSPGGLRSVLVLGASRFDPAGPRTVSPLSEQTYETIFSDGGFAALVERDRGGIALRGFGGASLGALWESPWEAEWDGRTYARPGQPKLQLTAVQALHESRGAHRDALKRCLDGAGIKVEDVDRIIFPQEPGSTVDRTVLRQIGGDPARLFREPGGPSHIPGGDQLFMLERLLVGGARPGERVLLIARSYGVMRCALLELPAADRLAEMSARI